LHAHGGQLRENVAADGAGAANDEGAIHGAILQHELAV
jgi:hypothetical protein